MALLLLRITVVALLITVGVHYSGSFFRLVLAAVLLVSISLLIGFLTPFLCVISGAFIVGNIILNPDSSTVVCVVAIVNAVALGLLGPGAYSLDSKLFGRQVTVVRPRNRTNYC